MKAQFSYSSPHKVLKHKDIRVEFTGNNLTKFGGMNLVRKFLIRLKVKEELENAVEIENYWGLYIYVPVPKMEKHAST